MLVFTRHIGLETRVMLVSTQHIGLEMRVSQDLYPTQCQLLIRYVNIQRYVIRQIGVFSLILVIELYRENEIIKLTFITCHKKRIYNGDF